VVKETTALGAAYAAGLATGFFKSTEELRTHWAASKTWKPRAHPEYRDKAYRMWKKAVTRSFEWLD
jgi:glycerol kinase